MPRFVTVARTDEIGPGQREVFDVEGIWIAVFNVGGTYYAIEDVCTHDDGPLGDGDLEGYNIVCPRHGAEFDVRTGKVMQMPAVVDVPAYPVRTRDGKIFVGIPKD